MKTIPGVPAIAAAAVALFAAGARGADAPPAADCLTPSVARLAGELKALPATRLDPHSPILPRSSDGLFEFRRPIAQGRTALFAAPYENPLQHTDAWTNLDAVPEAAKLAGPNDTKVDGTLIHVTVPGHDLWPMWESSSYVFVACDAAKPASVAAWGLTKATVAGPTLPAGIALLVLILSYVGGAAFVVRLRALPHPLGARYPALREAKPVSLWRLLDPVALTSNAVNQASPQKLQALFFTMIVAGIVMYTVLTTGVLSSISLSVLPLLGISAIGAAVAQAQATGKERLSFENWSWLVGKGVLPIARGGNDVGKWGELVTTGREFDIYKFQTLLFSLVVGIALIRDYADISSFTIPQALLGILGLSQIVYIGGTLSKPPSVAELNDALDQLRELDAKGTLALKTGQDTDPAGAPLPTAANAVPQKDWLTSEKALPNIHVLVARQAAQVARMIESTFEIPVQPETLNPDAKAN